MDKKVNISFWGWLSPNDGSRPGFAKIFDKWILFHLSVGVVMSVIIDDKLKDCSKSVLLPLASILFGMSFAFGVSAQNLLQTEEIKNIAEYKEGGLTYYIHSYQLSILIILVTLILWGLAGLGFFEVLITKMQSGYYGFFKFFLFSMASLSVRECWSIVLGTQYLIIIRNELNKKRKIKE